MLAILTFVEIVIENSKNSKKNQNDVRLSRDVIIYVLVSKNNNKSLEYDS